MANFFERWILEACILAVLSHEDTYGYKIAKIKELTVSESTVYPALRNLKDNGYLSVYSQTDNTRLRKLYSITPKGQERLSVLKEKWEEYKNTVAFFLG